MAATIRARRLLRDHFLKRFLDNDLISPNTDRHEVLVLLAASLAVPGLVITVLLLGQKLRDWHPHAGAHVHRRRWTTSSSTSRRRC